MPGRETMKSLFFTAQAPISFAAARTCPKPPVIDPRSPLSGLILVVVNIGLGWTFIGWLLAFAWALDGKDRPPHQRD